MSASQVPVAIASSVSPATAAQAPSSCSGPRSCVNVCSGWSEKRRAWGASAASGVPPLVCAIHGPGSMPAATAAIARSGTQRRTRSPRVGVDLDAALAQPRAHRAPDAPTRPDDNHSVDQSVLQFPSDTGLLDECNAEVCRLLPALELPDAVPRPEARQERGRATRVERPPRRARRPRDGMETCASVR